jgi:hypothetical protein
VTSNTPDAYEPSILRRSLCACAPRRGRVRLRQFATEERATVFLAVVPCEREKRQPAADRGVQQRLRWLQLQRVRQGPSSRRRSAGLACERALREQLVEHAPLLRNRARRERNDRCLCRCGVAERALWPSPTPHGRLLILGYQGRNLPHRLSRFRPRRSGHMGCPRCNARSTPIRRPAAPLALIR